MTRMLLEQGDGVVAITLDNPNQRNVLDEEWWQNFDRVLDVLESSEGLRVVTVTGNGSAFCAGGDIARMEQSIAAMEAGTFAGSERARMDRNTALLLRWAALPAIRVAAINGPAVGAGLALALSCDHRLIASTAFLDSGFSRMGLPGDLGATYYLPRILGPHRAQQWLLRARRIQPDEALSLGLVDEIVAPDALADATATVARSYGDLSATAVSWVLRRDPAIENLARALEQEREATVESKQAQFHRDAVRTFVGAEREKSPRSGAGS